MNAHETADWESRLARLEGTNRNYRRGTLALGIALLATLASGAASPQEISSPDVQVEALPVLESLRVRRIDIVDSGDRVTCTLMSQEVEGETAGGLIVLRNGQGKSICRLGSNQGYGAISLHGITGSTVCTLGALNGAGSVELHGADGTPASHLRADANGALLELRGEADTGVALSSDASGELATRALDAE